MSWELLDSGEGSAVENMERDRQLLAEVGHRSTGLLHLYDWRGECATYGHFLEPERLLDLKAAERCGLSLARRPTGGGIIFHIWDLAFSALMPASHPEFSLNTLENYATINRRVVEAVGRFLQKPVEATLLPYEPTPLDAASFHFCMAKPTKYDVVASDGRKIGGAAQRRTREGLLHQGTLSIVSPPEEYLNTILLPGTRVVEAMGINSFTLINGPWNQSQLNEARTELKELLQDCFLRKGGR